MAPWGWGSSGPPECRYGRGAVFRISHSAARSPTLASSRPPTNSATLADLSCLIEFLHRNTPTRPHTHTHTHTQTGSLNLPLDPPLSISVAIVVEVFNCWVLTVAHEQLLLLLFNLLLQSTVSLGLLVGLGILELLRLFWKGGGLARLFQVLGAPHWMSSCRSTWSHPTRFTGCFWCFVFLLLGFIRLPGILPSFLKIRNILEALQVFFSLSSFFHCHPSMEVERSLVFQYCVAVPAIFFALFADQSIFLGRLHHRLFLEHFRNRAIVLFFPYPKWRFCCHGPMSGLLAVALGQTPVNDG